MLSPLERAIISTLAYADVFGWPLKSEEIGKYLISHTAPNLAVLNKALSRQEYIRSTDGYYHLVGRSSLVDGRKKKEKASRLKLKIARRVGRLLYIIPTVHLVGITGNLSLMAAGPADDIDLIIIARQGSVWLTRLLCVILLKILGVYRSRQASRPADKICLNMLVDDLHLTLPRGERDLYSAHEIVQMKPLFARAGYGSILVRQNPWLKKYLPNAFSRQPDAHRRRSLAWGLFLPLLEYPAKCLQLAYMQNHRSSEVIKEGYLRFHPKDARPRILSEYGKTVNKYL